MTARITFLNTEPRIPHRRALKLARSCRCPCISPMDVTFAMTTTGSKRVREHEARRSLQSRHRFNSHQTHTTNIRMSAVPSLPVSPNPAFNKLVTHSALRTAQGFALVAPPLYLVSSLILRRGRFSVRRLMTTSIGATTGGAALGAGVGYARLMNEDQLGLDERILRMTHNIRTDDYSVIGSVLGALLVPTVFLHRASLPLLILGGGSLGLGAGVCAHLAQSLSEGRQIKPEGMVGELPVVGGNKK